MTIDNSCKGCLSKSINQLKPLTSNVDWKLELPPNFEVEHKDIFEEFKDLDEDDEIDGMRRYEILKEYGIVMIKLDGGCIDNKKPETNLNGECSLDRFLPFFCCNEFRLTHPKIPQTVTDVYVLGEYVDYDEFTNNERMHQVR